MERTGPLPPPLMVRIVLHVIPSWLSAIFVWFVPSIADAMKNDPTQRTAPPPTADDAIVQFAPSLLYSIWVSFVPVCCVATDHRPKLGLQSAPVQ